MKIIILGAGQVGGSLALSLANESNDITLVDSDPGVLHEIQDRADLRTVIGHAAHPSVLEQAGARDASMVVALTNSDETNMVACQVAYTLFHTPTKIARVRTTDYLDYEDLFVQEALPVDVLISPEYLVSTYVENLIEHPGALQVLNFAGGKVKLVAVALNAKSMLRGKRISAIFDDMKDMDTTLVAMYRDHKLLTIEQDVELEAGDELFFIASAAKAKSITTMLQGLDKPNRRVIIAGGGNIGLQLAQILEPHYRVKLIERDSKRAKSLSETLDKTIVLQGDAADENLLMEENIDSVDVFLALTNDDEANILSAMLAKRLGARKTMSLINRPSYIDLVESGMIDIAISPQHVTIGALLAHIRRGDVVAVHSLRKGYAEAIEAVAHGDHKTSKVVGRKIKEIKLPASASIGAIVRSDEVIIAEPETLIESEDHVIIYLADKHKVSDVERLFQVSATFI
ncbi:MAG: Trk system potassium transport protein TrkA [Gammaproteobacteria bacterium TMED119]|nr:MAG: Trk system potassium transport protein TrkA [Gammaproteobacteria bacterium TMED119]|tara:strand:+ start:2684 stop:4057 length:1374 start_codon:yes stop_codon:yes gene_type:complete